MTKFQFTIIIEANSLIEAQDVLNEIAIEAISSEGSVVEIMEAKEVN